MTEIRIHPPRSAPAGEVRVPYSKPHMQRAILFSLLANAPSVVVHPAWSSEAESLLRAAQGFGLGVGQRDDHRLVLTGVGKSLSRHKAPSPLSMEGSAFNFRTVAALACLLSEETVLEADASMLARPVLEHLRFVQDLGADIEDLSDATHLRVRVSGGSGLGGETTVDTLHSSQVLTSVLLIAPLAERPVRIHGAGPRPVGSGYVGLTLAMMRDHGIDVTADGGSYTVHPGSYQSRLYHLASDFTALSYPACAVLTGGGGTVTVLDYCPSALSSETEFLATLNRLGIAARHDPVEQTLRIECTAPEGRHVEIDGRNIPTVVPTLAALAPFVDARVTLRNAAHVNNHKSRRIEVMIAELRRLGCAISPTYDRTGSVDGFTTSGPQRPAGGVPLSGHGDHRIFMSLATAALGARRPTPVDGAEYLHASYPGYLRSLGSLGIRWEWGEPELGPAHRTRI
ncbi:hypothetical protein [Streptomyces sp. NPDC047525]|uniref:3-phosphoshikimate 1-carboxyvinyltransferase n=1 Tax=Streptomyces sp. NPDC047525 TaxID=3155264 RepID=UPI0033E3125D